MAGTFWPEAKASIVLLPSGEQGETILVLAGEWTRMGLIGPALWVVPEAVDVDTAGPPFIQAMVLGVGRDQETTQVRVDLFEALAREPLAVVRLIKLRSAVPSRAHDAIQDAIADRVREYVRKSMPTINPAANVLDQASELTYATLICAPSEFQLRQRVDWASGEYGAVVIASPEDRSSPWSGDAFVRENDRFVGFTLLHLASIAGLWNGVGVSSFELFRREESGHESVWISRVFLNAVLTESLGRRTAARVLTEVARPDSLLVDASVSAPPVGTAFIDDGLVDSYVEGMVSGAMRLGDGALGFRSSPDAVDPARRRVGIWRQLARFFVFAVEKLVRMPYWTWRWLTSQTSRRLTRLLHTDEGAAVVGPDLAEVYDARDLLLVGEARGIRDAEAAARAAMNAPASIAHLRTTPALWARLRELVFGSLDGSADLSDLGFTPVEGNVPVFGRVSDVLALPGDPWTAPRDRLPPDFPEAVDWYTLATGEPRAQLEGWAADATARRVVAGAEASRLHADVVRLRAFHAVAEALPPAFAAEPDPALVNAPPPKAAAVPMTAERARLNDATARADTAHAAFQSCSAEEQARADTLQQYDGWSQAQDRSFIWRLLGRLSDEGRAARTAAAGYAAQIEQTEVPAIGRLVRLRRRFHATMLIGWLIALLVGGLIWLGFVLVAARQSVAALGAADAERLRQFLWIILAIVVIAALILTLIALIAYHAGWSRFQRRVDLAHARIDQLGRSSRHARQEVTRLRSLHRQTVDWLTLLSRGIHHPWHVPPRWLEREDYEVARVKMPFALQIATIRDEEHGATARLRGVMTDRLVVRGWRHDAFESLVAEVARSRGSTGASFGLAALDEDLPHSSNHTRKMLMAAMGDETILTRVAGPRLDELVRAGQRSELGGGRPRVQLVGDNPLRTLVRAADPYDTVGDDLDWDEFLLGSLVGRRDPVSPLSSTVLAELEVHERHHERVTSYLALPERLESHLSFAPNDRVKIAPFRGGGAAPVDVVWRVDIVGPVPRSAIRLWSDQDAPPAPSAPAKPSSSSGSPDSGV